jgi:CNT family concentrative nucleoside transporter
MVIQSIAGLLVFAGIAWCLSENRKQVSIKIPIVGILIQLAVGIVLLKLPIFREFFLLLNRMVLSLQAATTAGTPLFLVIWAAPTYLSPRHFQARALF